MCESVEDIFNEYIKEAKYQVAVETAMRVLKRGKLTHQEIAEVTSLPLETVKELAEQMKLA